MPADYGADTGSRLGEIRIHLAGEDVIVGPLHIFQESASENVAGQGLIAAVQVRRGAVHVGNRSTQEIEKPSVHDNPESTLSGLVFPQKRKL